MGNFISYCLYNVCIISGTDGPPPPARSLYYIIAISILVSRNSRTSIRQLELLLSFPFSSTGLYFPGREEWNKYKFRARALISPPCSIDINVHRTDTYRTFACVIVNFG